MSTMLVSRLWPHETLVTILGSGILSLVRYIMHKRVLWLPIAIGVIVINAAGGIYASLTNEPVHAFVHGAFAVSFGMWAWYLVRQRPRQSSRHIEHQDEVEMLHTGMSELERELRETQERLDFADQLLKKQQPPEG